MLRSGPGAAGYGRTSVRIRVSLGGTCNLAFQSSPPPCGATWAMGP
jgi:hypothetical protein